MDNATLVITNKAIKNTKWVFLSTIFSKVWQPIVTIILARFLIPEDFGLMAMLLVAISFADLFKDMGMSAFLVWKREEVPEVADIVFITSIVSGTAWYLILYFTAPYLASFFHNDIIVTLLRIFSFTFVINAFSTVHSTLLSRRLFFRKIFLFGVISRLTTGIISIFLAISGFGVWSLIIGPLTGSVLNLFVMWGFVPWRPRLRYDWGVAREMLKFGGNISLETFFVWLIMTADNVFVGRLLGASQLGIYNLGFNLAHWPATNVTNPLSGLLFPTFCELQTNKEELRKIYLKVLLYVSIIVVPIGLMLFILSPYLIPLIYGNKWLEMVPIVRILATMGVFSAIVSIAGPIYKAIGRPDILVKFFAIRAGISIPIYYYTVKNGLISLSIAHLVLVLIFAPINLYIAMRILSISYQDIARALYLPIICSLGMGVVVLVILNGLSNFTTYPFQLFLSVVISTFFYVFFIKIINPITFSELKGVLRAAIL